MFGGKPSEGTIASIYDQKTNEEITDLRSILIEKKCLNTAKMFEFMIKKTHDPEDRFLKAVKFFSSEYYNYPVNFDGSFTATFTKQSEIVKKLLKKKKCNVQFFERETGFQFKVLINKLKKNDAEWKYTFFHNSFFNPSLSENIEILCFNPVLNGLKKIN